MSPSWIASARSASTVPAFAPDDTTPVMPQWSAVRRFFAPASASQFSGFSTPSGSGWIVML